MKRYYITVLGYYRELDTTKEVTIECDGMNYSDAGAYQFYNKTENGYEEVAYYPILKTIITKIETV
jgi:hypothetical protein